MIKKKEKKKKGHDVKGRESVPLVTEVHAGEHLNGFVLRFLFPNEAKEAAVNLFRPCPKLFHLLGSVHSASHQETVSF